MRKTSQSLRLIACLLNISEAHNERIVESVALSATNLHIPKQDQFQGLGGKNSNGGVKCPATVLNIFSDLDYNRSVITIAAPIENIEESVYRACETAYDQIDLGNHCGGHPRLGSVDLVPIHPINSEVDLKECGQVAQRIGHRIVENIKGTSVFFFGHADVPQNRGLVNRRKGVNWYKGKGGMSFHNIGWDLGQRPSPRYGCTGVGAIPYITNCNVTINTKDLALGQEIAKSLRASTPGGLQGVQAMAFEHNEMVEIACNVEAFEDPSSDGQIQYTKAEEIENKIKGLANTRGVDTFGSKLVGFTPNEAYFRAEKALLEGNATVWKSLEQGLLM
ncbi:uncharacterized protein LOC116302436 [Actinia tenebrosa]|uniref:glutamate formimidoyltransferase n=1 Tax=Actinia tenebrosa TaxID=6105 RepID=A0A6P8ILT8_ACTTE|nr:uncharacterized protein LOC116302436 [Actinia tenebrosa]